jgi:hypothetical protein
MYMHIYMCIYAYMYIHTYVRTYVHTYIHIHIYMYVCMYVYTYVHLHRKSPDDLTVQWSGNPGPRSQSSNKVQRHLPRWHPSRVVRSSIFEAGQEMTGISAWPGASRTQKCRPDICSDMFGPSYDFSLILIRIPSYPANPVLVQPKGLFFLLC